MAVKTTGNLNLLSWIQEKDYDVWEYLYENYLVHIMNQKKTLAEIHRPLQFKRMFKNLQKVASVFDEQHESMCYARYVGGKYDISLPYRGKEWNQEQNQYWVAGFRLRERDLDKWSNRGAPPAMILDDASKDDLIEKCKECEIDYRKSCNKGKIMKAILNHPDN